MGESSGTSTEAAATSTERDGIQEEVQTNDIAAHYADLASSVAASLAPQTAFGRSSCCEVPMTGSEAAALYDAQTVAELPAGALAASRGCGDPIARAGIVSGETVCDLGCGGGIDALVAARLVGEEGRVIGIDMTPEMVALARRNAADAGCENAEFVEGDIEALPLPDGSVDVIVSNCVVNLASDKARVFREAFRVLVPGGRVVVSDIVMFEPLPEDAIAPVCEIVGCRNGMRTASDYATLLLKAGFRDVTVEPKTVYTLGVLEEKAARKHRETAMAAVRGRADIDGRCGSAIVTAEKPPAKQIGRAERIREEGAA